MYLSTVFRGCDDGRILCDGCIRHKGGCMNLSLKRFMGWRGCYSSLGASILFAWHYCFWFSPSTFLFQDLLDDDVTFLWLAYLAVGSISLLALSSPVKYLKVTEHHLARIASVSALLLSAVSFLVVFSPLFGIPPTFRFVLMALMGAIEALCWIVQGRRIVDFDGNLVLMKELSCVGAVVLTSLAATAVLPSPYAAVFSCALPLFIIVFFPKSDSSVKGCDIAEVRSPGAKKRSKKNLTIVSAASFVASASCYYLFAIIPLGDLPWGSWSYFVGVVAGTFLVFAFAVFSAKRSHAPNLFATIPWMLVMTIAGLSLFLSGVSGLSGIAFFFTSTVYSTYAMVLVLYFAAIAKQGLIRSDVSFGVSLGVFRLGVLVGDALSVFMEGFEARPEAAISLATCLFIVMLASMMPITVPERGFFEGLSRKDPLPDNSIMAACFSVAEAFSLSKRESEILAMLARGYSARNISDELVLSIHTVQSHIRRINSKLGVHSRSELFRCIKDEASIK